MKNLSKFSTLLMQYLGTPYKWGGQDASGMDCSGLMVKALWDMGKDISDMTAQMIHDWLLKGEGICSVESPVGDCFLFFGDDKNSITHVAYSIDTEYMIEAGGAGKNSLEMNRYELLKKDARVRISRIERRRDLVACVKVDLR